ncbi:adenylate cyclase [Vibrio mediterranei AK1]|nr:adenylate cyclase [Vibrio mediterranei AK1]
MDGFASEGLIQFFFEDTDNGFNIYVLDESNQVEVYHQMRGSKDEMIASVNSFYTSNVDSEMSSKLINFNLPQYYQLIHPEEGEPYIIPYRNDGSPNSKTSKAVNA